MILIYFNTNHDIDHDIRQGIHHYISRSLTLSSLDPMQTEIHRCHRLAKSQCLPGWPSSSDTKTRRRSLLLKCCAAAAVEVFGGDGPDVRIITWDGHGQSFVNPV